MVAVVTVLLCAIVMGASAFSFQDCHNLQKCAHMKIACKMMCACSNGKESYTCMKCWEGFNSTGCNECNPKGPTTYNVGNIVNNKVPTAHIEDCDFLTGLSCAAVILGCDAICSLAEIDLPACIACMGGSYATCKDCII